MRIKVPEGIDLTKLLTEAPARPLLLEKTGELFRLEGMEKEAKALSPEEVARSREGILKAASSWKDIDTEALKSYISERRRAANRPSVNSPQPPEQAAPTD